MPVCAAAVPSPSQVPLLDVNLPGCGGPVYLLQGCSGIPPDPLMPVGASRHHTPEPEVGRDTRQITPVSCFVESQSTVEAQGPILPFSLSDLPGKHLVVNDMSSSAPADQESLESVVKSVCLQTSSDLAAKWFGQLCKSFNCF